MRALLIAALLAAPAVAAPAFSPDRIKADVSFLADDLLEGRETGSRGHEIAARYVAAQFAVAGLTPGARDGSWFQRITLEERKLGAAGASLTITGPGGSRSWANGTAVVLRPSTSDPATDLTAPAVFVGYGLDAPAQGFDDFAGLDVRGKIVVYLNGLPKGPPNEIWAHLAATRAKMAAARGAVGSVGIDTDESSVRWPWARLVSTGTVPRMVTVGADGRPLTSATTLRGEASLDREPAEFLFAGAPVALAPLRAAVAAGERPKGFALPAAIRMRAAVATRMLTSPEVIGIIPGRDPKLRDEFVVLMAHVDHLGIRPEREGDKIYNGALDNAAGTAVMLEVARAFAAGPAPKRSIMFVANTGEEKGLLGAEGFANDPPVPIENIVSVVDLDQPMLLYDFTDVIAFGADHSTLGQSVARGAARAGVKLSPDPMPAETIFVRSDHYTFVKRGVPAILLATGYANGGEAAWKHYLATDYHQPSDDLSLPILWSAGAKYARVNYEIARDLADAPGRPRWYAHDYFGDSFAPTAAKVDRR